ncbi:hypothetical protein [Acinetobacter pittii]|jgi:hypothetical protein|uniref:hypothetical protein n=1 Tax=Acinetobacter pittii TaxID=48296 RepID=UPI000E5B915C|nr:hypothetical protein [Acinetobacter pittii]MBQ5174784.1 hypothetical protein [Acinetobacter pittii]MDH0178716.1 hypothetical protein [Acinetobacter pittii]MDH0691118.1 hypothetical protein [Acinetobacter pittii]QHQ33185.1 hypothetical protein EPY81_18200 [Acinetobacter pittii]USQ62867.1 hypothetical protein C7A15_19510 [Acinetobacter pittii]
MPLSFENLISESLLEICRSSTDDFTGTGIVYYKNLNNLPFISLHKDNLPEDFKFTQFNDLILEISKIISNFHDGFHFYNIENSELTHISQYISPLLTKNDSSKVQDILPCGAREMTAFLASMVDGIFCVGLISANKSVKIFKNGLITFQSEAI